MSFDQLQNTPLRNIMVVGSAGSGKSTLARRISEILGHRVIHMDHIYWQPNWVMRSAEAIHSLVIESIQAEGWIFEGNHSASYPDRLARADTIIWLKVPRALCLWRATLRALGNYGKSRPDMAEGCYDRLDWRFLKWVWNYPKNGRPKHEALFENTKHTHSQIMLHSQDEVEEFVQTLSNLQSKRLRAA